ncbi:HELP domain containing protein [Reticulomyxa filosa]|uniref:HELP domain containing protein n=1 Tax=Reticulomyxa filosa TaxID=46433 RepID=X6NZ96_RETFI|nr:HELP domain containing protein [Reticulomyxa filosa]|eukprot:ETO31164.1 HELP domain containing protein [Reticulomyxa filosa]
MKRATVCQSGIVRVWNFDAMHMNAVCEQTYSIRNSSGKVSAIGWTCDNKYLIVGTTTNKLLIYLIQPFKLIKALFIPNESSSNHAKKPSIILKQVPQKSELPIIKVICSSFNGKLCAIGYGRKGYILDLRKGKRQFSLWDLDTIQMRDHISHMYMSKDNLWLCVISEKYETQYFNVAMGENILKPATTLPPWTIEWWPKLPLTNWSLQGLYQEEWKEDELNDGDCLIDRALAASGDKFGIVRLHTFPALTKQPLFCALHHSTPVTSLFFLKDEKHLITINGNDKSIFCWRIE